MWYIKYLEHVVLHDSLQVLHDIDTILHTILVSMYNTGTVLYPVWFYEERKSKLGHHGPMQDEQLLKKQWSHHDCAADTCSESIAHMTLFCPASIT